MYMNEHITIRLTRDQERKIRDLLQNNKDKYNTVSDVIRSAINYFLREKTGGNYATTNKHSIVREYIANREKEQTKDSKGHIKSYGAHGRPRDKCAFGLAHKYHYAAD